MTTKSAKLQPQTAPTAGDGAARGAAGPVPAALDPRLYTDPATLDLELRRIFDRSWQYAGHVAELPHPGSYLSASAGDQPVLVVRREDGELRAFRNVCRHRGSELLTGQGRCKKAIRCRYHGWTYDADDGRLLGVPEHRGFAELDKSRLGLMGARVEVVAGLVFVNLDRDAPPLAETAPGLVELLERYRLPELVPFGGVDPGTQPANWKIVAENYLEGYHVPIAHPGLMRLYDYKRYSVEVHDSWVAFEAPLREAPSGNRAERAYQRLVRPMPGLSPEDHRVWRYVFLFPNTTIDLHPDQVTVWQIVPEEIARSRDVWGCFRAPHPGPVTRIVQRLNHAVNTRVLEEDVDLVARVQTGVRTRGYEPGPLSAREAGVGWFADRVRAALDGAEMDGGGP